MDYSIITKAIADYERMNSLEIQNQLKPIIKKYNRGWLEEYIGTSRQNLYRVCKKLFVERNQRLSFDTYIKLMALGENPVPEMQKANKQRVEHRAPRVKRTAEEKKAKLKDYNHKYYMEVTKKKRAEKRNQK